MQLIVFGNERMKERIQGPIKTTCENTGFLSVFPNKVRFYLLRITEVDK